MTGEAYAVSLSERSGILYNLYKGILYIAYGLFQINEEGQR